jgi:hypothetical protein
MFQNIYFVLLLTRMQTRSVSSFLLRSVYSLSTLSLSLSQPPTPALAARAQTGAGKTFTMAGEGSGERQGVQPRALRALLAACRPSTGGKGGGAAAADEGAFGGVVRRMTVRALTLGPSL